MEPTVGEICFELLRALELTLSLWAGSQSLIDSLIVDTGECAIIGIAALDLSSSLGDIAPRRAQLLVAIAYHHIDDDLEVLGSGGPIESTKLTFTDR
jgi:hypothetical protein